MAVISLSLCQPLSIVFIFDLIVIGQSILYGTHGLKDLLESKIIKKITFDCRIDSNALYHQFGISLTNCLDLQVFQLGISLFIFNSQSTAKKMNTIYTLKSMTNKLHSSYSIFIHIS